MLERIYRLVIKEFIHFFRQKRTVFFLIVPPVVQLLLFGYVATTDVNHVATALRDLDQTYESRELARQFEASKYFDIVYRPTSPGELTHLLDREGCSVPSRSIHTSEGTSERGIRLRSR